MNDLFYAIDECTLFTYANDTQLFKSADDIDQVKHAINTDLKKVDEWYEFNQMKRNHSKYQVITFSRVERNPVLTCEGIVISTQDEMELLGVTMLKFEGQIRKISRKVSQEVAVLNRLKKILPFELRLYIYRAFIAPHFKYCSESWHHCGKRGCVKLEKINEQALCFVTRDQSTMYETLLKQVNLLSPLNPRIVKWLPVSTKLSMGIKSLEE